MLDFQRYQAEFTAHLRNPSAHKKPKNVPDIRMAVYRELVFNNFLGSVSACFPVCISVLGTRIWRVLVRQFMLQHASSTPIFREIPQQFLAFLTNQDCPTYLKQLAHYEWAELEVAASLAIVNTHKQPLQSDSNIRLNPTALLLSYDYAVHQISKKNKPKKTELTFLLVFRNTDFEVKFIALNPATFALLTLIQTQDLTVSPSNFQNLTVLKCLKLFAEQIGQPVEAIEQFGLEMLQDLANQQAVIQKIS